MNVRVQETLGIDKVVDLEKYTVTHKSIGHIGFFKKIITFLVAINLKLELNIVDV